MFSFVVLVQLCLPRLDLLLDLGQFGILQKIPFHGSDEGGGHRLHMFWSEGKCFTIVFIAKARSLYGDCVRTACDSKNYSPCCFLFVSRNPESARLEAEQTG